MSAAISSDALNERGAMGRILLVADVPESQRALARSLREAGYEVVAEDSGESALRAVRTGAFDVFVTDLATPGMDNIAFLQLMREYDQDVPVVLVTASPHVDSAIAALEHGAFKYLVKPVTKDRLEAVLIAAMHVRGAALVDRKARQLVADDIQLPLEKNFDRALASLWLAYQPIVHRNGTLYGHEALLRSEEPSLPSPGHVLDAAEGLDRLVELGRRVRSHASLPVLDDGVMLFVNLHPRDLEDEELFSPDSPLSRIAARVVLEITERTSIASIHDLKPKLARLREQGFRIAIDDFGAGYAGLTSFALVVPDIVKIDMSLVRDVDSVPVKQRLIESMASVCRDMGILVVGEGVETRHERDTLVALGCDLFQGYAIARPARAFPTYVW